MDSSRRRDWVWVVVSWASRRSQGAISSSTLVTIRSCSLAVKHAVFRGRPPRVLPEERS